MQGDGFRERWIISQLVTSGTREQGSIRLPCRDRRINISRLCRTNRTMKMWTSTSKPGSRRQARAASAMESSSAVWESSIMPSSSRHSPSPGIFLKTLRWVCRYWNLAQPNGYTVWMRRIPCASKATARSFYSSSMTGSSNGSAIPITPGEKSGYSSTRKRTRTRSSTSTPLPSGSFLRLHLDPSREKFVSMPVTTTGMDGSIKRIPTASARTWS